MVFVALCLGVATASFACIWQVRSDRTYYPMLRVVFAGATLTFALLGFGKIAGVADNIWWRNFATACYLVATVWGAIFIRRRNRTPRYQPMDEHGNVSMPDLATLERHATEIESYIGHGGASPQMVARMAAACRKWSAYTEAQVAAANLALDQSMERLRLRREAREHERGAGR